MGLTGYRTYRDDFKDNGQKLKSILGDTFTPDFLNRNTLQIWDVSNHPSISIAKWKGATLTDRTLHEIYVVNNSNQAVDISLTNNYVLIDEETVDLDGNPNIIIGPMGTAHFYCSSVMVNNNLEFEMRTGSQDDRKI